MKKIKKRKEVKIHGSQQDEIMKRKETKRGRK